MSQSARGQAPVLPWLSLSRAGPPRPSFPSGQQTPNQDTRLIPWAHKPLRRAAVPPGLALGAQAGLCVFRCWSIFPPPSGPIPPSSLQGLPFVLRVLTIFCSAEWPLSSSWDPCDLLLELLPVLPSERALPEPMPCGPVSGGAGLGAWISSSVKGGTSCL